MDQIILSNYLQPDAIIGKNITFTAAEWAQYTAQINSDTAYFCYVFLGLGALVGALAVFLGIWYHGRQG